MKKIPNNKIAHSTSTQCIYIVIILLFGSSPTVLPPTIQQLGLHIRHSQIQRKEYAVSHSPGIVNAALHGNTTSYRAIYSIYPSHLLRSLLLPLPPFPAPLTSTASTGAPLLIRRRLTARRKDLHLRDPHAVDLPPSVSPLQKPKKTKRKEGKEYSQSPPLSTP